MSPEPPWEKYGTRGGLTVLSSRARLVTFRRPVKPKHGHGTIDPKHRIWQHSSSGRGIGGSIYEGCFAYGYSDEWKLIQDEADWVEFIDGPGHTVYRNDVETMRNRGRRADTPNGVRWLVPLSTYTRVPRATARARSD